MINQLPPDVKEGMLKYSDDPVFNWCYRHVPFFDIIDAYGCYYLWRVVILCLLVGMVIGHSLWMTE